MGRDGAARLGLPAVALLTSLLFDSTFFAVPSLLVDHLLLKEYDNT